MTSCDEAKSEGVNANGIFAPVRAPEYIATSCVWLTVMTVDQCMVTCPELAEAP